MCGIIGFVSREPRPAEQLLVEGLRALEYRGYDSAGLALPGEGKLEVLKGVGTLEQVAPLLLGPARSVQRGIAHTRWATHGGVTTQNAHPHVSCDGRIALVHNGILENYVALRSELLALGHRMVSQTDSEVAVHWIEEFVKKGHSLDEAVRLAVNRFEGSFAFLVMDNVSNILVAARRESPLILGVGKGVMFAASDPLPLLPHTRKVVFLNDGEMALLKPDGFTCRDFSGKAVAKSPAEFDASFQAADKGLYAHFMLKEILEQPQAVRHAASQDLAEVRAFASALREAKGVMVIASGTAMHAGMVGQYMFDAIARRHVNVVNASEFPYLQTSLHPGAVVVAVSQSGETADVLNAMKLAKKKGARLFSIVNVAGSSIARLSERSLSLRVGPEIAVASTKAFLGQVSLLYLLAHAMVGKEKEGQEQLKALSSLLEETIQRNHEPVKKLAASLKHSKDLYYIGRAVNYPLALEGALKMKEISYLHAEGMPAGELKHGTLALVEKGTPVILVNPGDVVRLETVSNAMETRARGARVIAVSDENHEAYDEWLSIPKAPEELYPLLAAVPLQLLAYYCAVELGRNPDKPRNLAKSVTVK